MKKTLASLLLASALLVFPVMANATNCLYGCFEPIQPLNASGEAQAFQHLDISYSQDAGVQDINSRTITHTEKEVIEADVNAYGSIHSTPDQLFFGDVNATLTRTETDSIGINCVTARVNVMDGTFSAASDAGASAIRVGPSEALSSAANNFVFNQTQTFPYAQGGQGVQTLTASGYTNVSAQAPGQ